jgi:hypothetical protein
MSVHKYYCPGCSKEGDICIACFFDEQSMLRLDLPYVTCSGCHLVYYDKMAVRRKLSIWRKASSSSASRTPPFWETYHKVIRLLDGIMEQRKQYGGYAYRRFTLSDQIPHNGR